ncbi:MAG: HAD-IIA family hydrolase [Smithella sp.]|jgi:HAD superfamily hydrolase (TIGR01450 family)
MEFIKAVAFDLDGTIYIGDKLVNGVTETLKYLKNKNIKIFYFTNNSAKTRQDIHKKLQKLNLDPEIETIYNTAYATGEYLKENGFKKVYCCGSSGLKEEISRFDIKCIDDKEMPEAVIVGLDHGFNYEKMAVALNILKNKKIKFIICNRDRTYPAENSRLMPGCGPIVAALEFAASRQAEVIIGKPEIFMLDLLCRDWNFRKEEIFVVGDSLESDIAMADAYGSPSLLLDCDDKHSVNAKKIRSITEIKNYI